MFVVLCNTMNNTWTSIQLINLHRGQFKKYIYKKYEKQIGNIMIGAPFYNVLYYINYRLPNVT